MHAFNSLCHLVTMDAHEAYAELIRRAREQTRSWAPALRCWVGTSRRSCLPAAQAIALPRWACWPASTMSARPIPGSASFSRSSRSSDLVAEPASPPAVNVRELRRSYDRRVRLPRTLVEELARTTSLAQPEWVAARSASDFARFRPWLEKIIQLKRQESACLSQAVGRCWPPRCTSFRRCPAREARPSGCPSVYDPLLDELRARRNDSRSWPVVFQAVRRDLIPSGRKDRRGRAGGPSRDFKPPAVSCSSDRRLQAAVRILNRSYPLRSPASLRRGRPPRPLDSTSIAEGWT